MSLDLQTILRPRLDWLLILAPVAIGLEIAHHRGAAWAGPQWIFLTAAIAVIPLAGWMGHATEKISSRLGEGIGGMLNATFGNAAELIIAGLALVAAARDPSKADAMHQIVKASLTGSIIGNTLLVLGLALLVGGVRHKFQRFNVTAARVASTLLTLAVVGLLIPDIFVHTLPSSEAESAITNLSAEVAVVLLVAYGLSLWFTLHTHKHLYVGHDPAALDPVAKTSSGHAAHGPPAKLLPAMGVLIAATIGVGVLAELMVGSVHEAAHIVGLNEVFVGVVVVAIVGNAAEHSTAVIAAWNNRLDMTLAIAVGSSIQIALFVAPVLVLFSYVLGVPMTMVFTLPEIVAVTVSVWIVQQISGDGETNWLEGVLLLMVYVLLGVFFYHL